MKTTDFATAVKERLSEYKRETLNVSENGVWRGREYGHILPKNVGHKNIMLDENDFRIDGDTLTFTKSGKGIKLHEGYHHLNSSQILCVNYFYPFLSDINKLTELVRFLGIDENASGAEFEFTAPDSSNIDFVIFTEGGRRVYMEIKYCESDFGAASSKKAIENGTYAAIKEKYHQKAEIDFDGYLKNYQLIRNISLSHKDSGSLTVFLVPRDNESINRKYDEGIAKLRNHDDFNFKRVYWEDLIASFGNKEIEKKYFGLCKKKLDENTVRVIKISKDALFEFIYEQFNAEQEIYLETDSLEVANAFEFDEKNGEFIFCAYKFEDEKGRFIELPKEINLKNVMKNIPDTTQTMFGKKRYKDYTKKELAELSKEKK